MASIKLGTYRHFKGRLYYALDTAKHSETQEEYVIYKSKYGDRGTWIRPLSMFTEIVERDGKRSPRFELLS